MMALHSQSELYSLVAELLADKEQSAKLTDRLRRDLRSAADAYESLQRDYSRLIEDTSPSIPLMNPSYRSMPGPAHTTAHRIDLPPVSIQTFSERNALHMHEVREGIASKFAEEVKRWAVSALRQSALEEEERNKRQGGGMFRW